MICCTTQYHAIPYTAVVATFQKNQESAIWIISGFLLIAAIQASLIEYLTMFAIASSKEASDDPPLSSESSISFPNFEAAPNLLSADGCKDRSKNFDHIIKSTTIDQETGRFSPFKNRNICWKCKTFFTWAIMCLPLAVFVVMMWFQLYRACTAQSVFYGVLSPELVDSYLKQDGVHYCAATFQSQSLNFTTGKIDSSFYACNLPGEFNHFDFHGQCSVYKDLFNNVSPEDNGCFNGGSIQIMYVQCTATPTAIINSIQVTIYICVALAFVSLAFRVIKRFGCHGIVESKNWSAVLKHNYDEIETDGHRNNIMYHMV